MQHARFGLFAAEQKGPKSLMGGDLIGGWIGRQVDRWRLGQPNMRDVFLRNSDLSEQHIRM